MSSKSSALRQSSHKQRLHLDGGGRVPLDLVGQDLAALDRLVGQGAGKSRADVLRKALRAYGQQGTDSERPIALRLTDEQAAAVAEALDVFVRLGLGQLDCVAELVSTGVIPMRADASAPKVLPNIDTVEAMRDLMRESKALLGFQSNSSMGVGHAHHGMSGRRAYEVYKAVSRAVAMRRNPNPEFHGVHYDGLTVRYTQDSPPIATWLSLEAC